MAEENAELLYVLMREVGQDGPVDRISRNAAS
jgi:hypothetical protein